MAHCACVAQAMPHPSMPPSSPIVNDAVAVVTAVTPPLSAATAVPFRHGLLAVAARAVRDPGSDQRRRIWLVHRSFVWGCGGDQWGAVGTFLSMFVRFGTSACRPLCPVTVPRTYSMVWCEQYRSQLG